jgi:hypothetical protein
MGGASLFNTMRARINGKCAIVDLCEQPAGTLCDTFVASRWTATPVNWHAVDARGTSQGSGRSRKAALANALNKARSLTHAGEGSGLAGGVAGPQMVRT